MNLTKPPLPVIFLFALLAGCATLPSSDSGCMKTVLVSSLSKVPLSPAIKGDNRFLTVSDFKGGCNASNPGFLGTGGDIGITMTVAAPEAKHKHGKTQKIRVPVFIALLDKQDNVLDRQDEKVDLTINDHSLIHTEKMTYRLPQGISKDSEGHRLLVGLNGPVKMIPSSAPRPSGIKKKKK